MTTLRTADPRIDFCIMSLQSAGIETDWEAFRAFIASHPTADDIATKTPAIMRQSGFGADEIALFSGSAAEEIQSLVNALASEQGSGTTQSAPTAAAPAKVNVGDPITLDEALMLDMIHQIRHGLTVRKVPIPDKYTLDCKGDVHNSTWVSINQHALAVGQMRGISGRNVVLAALAVVSDTATPDQRRTLAAWLDTNPNLPGDTTIYRANENIAGSDQYAADITNLRRRTHNPADLDLALRTVRTTKRTA